VRMTRWSRGWWASAALALTTACYADSYTSPDNIGWVTTLVDSTTSSIFTARTFAVPDTVVELRGDVNMDHAVDRIIVDRVRSNFLALGWTEVRDTSGPPPDVLVVLGASTRTEVGYTYVDWYSAWGYLPYWGATADPTWAWGVPGGAIPYVYEVGTLLMTMVDLRAPRETTRNVPVLWVAAINGVLSADATLPRVLTGVDQAFTQSPYLEVVP
jgi:Domain of unknown function (DUF4136)